MRKFYLIRTITLNAVTLGCLIWFWFNEVDCSRRNENDRDWIDSELDCRPVSKRKRVSNCAPTQRFVHELICFIKREKRKHDERNINTLYSINLCQQLFQCWENFMGEQIYRLVIIDFVFLLLLTFISEFLRK